MDNAISSDCVYKLCNKTKDNEEARLGGEDSSYDSDFEGEEITSHQNVSRTASDTLAAEFSEYVCEDFVQSANYTAKIEFGLKLGYTEKHVQTALGKLGPNPSQNELLAELIQLGAQSREVSRTLESEVETANVGDKFRHEGNVAKLRPIVIDGSNVAMSHGNKEVFSCRGIKICVDWFKNRGHKEITVFVPKWRKEASRPDNLISDQGILYELEKERIVVFTPSRLLGGRRTICYDDRYILRLAVDVDGIVVSNDNYRDLAQENLEFRKIIEERILMYSFVNDRFMPPDDPLGRSGPTLDNFLKIHANKSDPGPLCPYGKKCTYGNKCKFNHPERGSMPHKSVSERLVEHAQKHWQARENRDFCNSALIKGKSLSVPLSEGDDAKTLQKFGVVKKISLTRTKSGHPPSMSMETFNSKNLGVGKSKSVENILNDKVFVQAMRKKSKISDQQFLQEVVQSNSQCATSQFSGSEPDTIGKRTNLHRKLERQLTLNPYEVEVSPTSQWGIYPNRVHFDGSYWNHQNLTRISSAPGSSLSGVSLQPSAQHQMHRINSTSDSHINLCASEGSNFCIKPEPWVPVNAPAIYSSKAGNNRQPSSQSWCQLDPQSKKEARRKLHYHLSSIFPEEHVRAVLQSHPNETKPQEICAAILAMYPNK